MYNKYKLILKATSIIVIISLVLPYNLMASDNSPVNDCRGVKSRACQKASSEKVSSLSNSTNDIHQKVMDIQNKRKEKYEQKVSKELEENSNMSSQRAEVTYKRYDNNTKMQTMTSKYQKNLYRDIKQSFNVPDSMLPKRDKLQEYIDKNGPKGAYAGRSVYVFVSSSMPDTTVQNLMESASGKKGIVFVLRGLVGEKPSIKPTAEWIGQSMCDGESILFMSAAEKEKADCLNVSVDINPMLFRRFGIREVPAVVYVPDPQETVMQDKSAHKEDFFAFYGDVSMRYALGRISLARDDDPKLSRIIDQFDESYYN